MRSERIEVALKKPEIDARAHTLAEKVTERRKVADDAKAESAKFKKLLKPLDEEIKNLSKAVTEGKEFQFVEVEDRFDYKRATCEIVRVDTGEVIDTRAMDPDELVRESQPSLLGSNEPARQDADPANPKRRKSKKSKKR